MTITKIADNPGLYPLVLGNARIKESEWTFIKPIDYSPLIDDYLTLKSTLVTITQTLENRSFFIEHRQAKDRNDVLISHNNFLLIISQYLDKADRLIKQIFPEISLRKKRGLIDGLGTVFKFLTGNLDASDGERYEKTILKLQNRNDIHNKILLEQTHILNDTLGAIQNLKNNQDLLNSNLNKIILQHDDLERHISAVSVRNVLNEAILSLQLFINVWTELENALTFAQNQQTHMSLLDNDELIANLNQISIYLGKSSDKTLTIPYPANPENLHLYESIIISKAYQLNRRITFIFEIPLVHKDQLYQLTQLIPFPIYHKENQYRMIIPTYNTLLFNTIESIPIDMDHCKLVNLHAYFCYQKNHFKIPNDKLCETQLLSFSANQTCTPYLFELKDLKISQIDTSTWLITTPFKITIDIKCPDQNYRQDLSYSNIIHLTPDCTAMINHDTLLFYIKTTSTKTVDLRITNIDKLNFKLTSHINISKLDLIPINTQKLIADQLQIDKQQIMLDSVGNIDNHNIISIISVTITIIIILLIISFIVYIFCKRNSFKKRIMKFINSKDVDTPIELVTSKI